MAANQQRAAAPFDLGDPRIRCVQSSTPPTTHGGLLPRLHSSSLPSLRTLHYRPPSFSPPCTPASLVSTVSVAALHPSAPAKLHDVVSARHGPWLAALLRDWLHKPYTPLSLTGTNQGAHRQRSQNSPHQGLFGTNPIAGKLARIRCILLTNVLVALRPFSLEVLGCVAEWNGRKLCCNMPAHYRGRRTDGTDATPEFCPSRSLCKTCRGVLSLGNTGFSVQPVRILGSCFYYCLW